ncbi:MAG: gamma-glutamyl-phosphate reductase, partial [Alphaproteobacteria bacterium]
MPPDPAEALQDAARAACAATTALAAAPRAIKDQALLLAAAALREREAQIIAANAEDIAAAPGLSPAFRDRLLLNGARIEAMVKGLEEVAALPDPVGRVLAEWQRPNGLRLQRVAQPLGVIGMIFESRP